jgi:Variant SH3 domain
MSRVVVIEAHEIPQRPPLSLAAGDVVAVGRRDDDWPAFVFVTAARGSGWVPSRYVAVETGHAVVVTAYDTTELPTRVGETLDVVGRDDESGWLWCRSADGREAGSQPDAPIHRRSRRRTPRHSRRSGLSSGPERVRRDWLARIAGICATRALTLAAESVAKARRLRVGVLASM